MLTRSPKHGPWRTSKLVEHGAVRRAAAEKLVPDWDRAFRAFGIDPSEPDALERVRDLAVAWHYPTRRPEGKKGTRGRPRGSKKWDQKARAQFFWDATDVIVTGHYMSGGHLSQQEVADRLKEMDRYKHLEPPRLRQLVSMLVYRPWRTRRKYEKSHEWWPSSVACVLEQLDYAPDAKALLLEAVEMYEFGLEEKLWELNETLSLGEHLYESMREVLEAGDIDRVVDALNEEWDEVLAGPI